MALPLAVRAARRTASSKFGFRRLPNIIRPNTINIDIAVNIDIAKKNKTITVTGTRDGDKGAGGGRHARDFNVARPTYAGLAGQRTHKHIANRAIRVNTNRTRCLFISLRFFFKTYGLTTLG